MNTLIDNLDDSALFCKSLIQKRKLTNNDNPKNSKQLKLDFSQSSKKAVQLNGKQMEGSSKKITAVSQDSKWDESSSSYFTNKKSVNICPLCLKSFKTDSSYSAHMKQCAKAHKMSTKQLLSALELQKKQMLKTQDVGLCSQKATSPVKANTKKKNVNDAELYDLALGLALSESLTGTESKGVTAPEVQKSTLEEFGFKSSNATTGLCKKMYKKSVLKERTTEERQRILIEKVAVILLDENQESNFENVKLSSTVRQNQVSQLWSMGESNEKSGWYVNEIKTLLLPSEENVVRIETLALPKETSEESTNLALPENISREISKLNLPRPEIYKDWSKMINNSTLSDFKAKTKDCRDVYLHSFVLYVRCEEILKKDYEAVIEKFNFSTIICFLEFLYCGTLNGLVRSEVDNLINLTNEFNYKELREVLDCLKNNLSESGDEILNSSKNKIKKIEISATENLEDKDLFAEDDEENNTNVEKSYWSFIQHEKKKNKLEEMQEIEKEKGKTASGWTEKIDTKAKNEEEILVLKNQSELRRMSEDSATKDLDYDEKIHSNTNSDCIILCSGSDSKTPENLVECKTPLPVNVDYEVPYFDPFDNFHCFSEEPFSPVAIHSQSLIMGDISLKSPKSDTLLQKNNKEKNDMILEDSKKSLGYCSTPVRVHKSFEVTSATGSLDRSRRRKRCDLSASRILRKSLNLQQKTSSTKKRAKKKYHCEELAEALTNSVFTELSKSSAFKLSPTTRGFVEVTPISGREEFVDNITPSPNYSNMGESLIKEQLTMYGLKKNLAKSKAKKILRHIYEELHPLYNTETGKIVKKLSSDTPKIKKTKPKACSKTTNSKCSKNGNSEKTKKKRLNISVESLLSNGSGVSLDSLTDDSPDSEFGNLNDTLTQSIPNNPVDLPSAFCEYIQSNPDFYEKILLYEPIWIEDLQRKLKEIFKKHFKIADLMDYLDQKCITFRSETQTKNIQRRNEKKKKPR